MLVPRHFFGTQFFETQNKLFNFIFCRPFKNIHFGSNSVFCTDGILCTLSGDLERIEARSRGIMVTHVGIYDSISQHLIHMLTFIE